MATLTFELRDKKGNDVELGDLVRVWLPEVDHRTISFDYGVIDLDPTPERIVVAKVVMFPSSGLHLKIVEIIDDGGCPEDTPQPGTYIPFRRTSWEWEPERYLASEDEVNVF
jgi:hypothetical protein